MNYLYLNSLCLLTFILGIIIGCKITLPIVLSCIKSVNKNMYDKGCQDTLERFSSGNNKKTN